MSKAPSAPQPVNPYQVGNAQQQANINSALANAHLNNVNVNSPTGSISYTYGSPQAAAAAPASRPAFGLAQQAGPMQTTNARGMPIGNNTANALTQLGLGNKVQQAPRPTVAAPAPAGGAAPAASGTNPGGVNIGGTFVPNVSENITLSPAQQQLLETQQGLEQGLGSLGTKLAGNVPTTALNYNNAPALGDPGQINQQAENAVYQQQTAMLDPQWAEQQKQLTDQWSAQGIPQGSQAWQQQMDAFNRQKTLAYQQAKDSAIQEGYNVGAQTFGEQLGARQQGVGEANQLYTQPANTLAQLMSAYGGGGVTSPATSTAASSPVAPSDITGAFGLAQQGNQANYGAQMQQYGANLGGLTGLAGMLALGAGL